MLKKFMSTTNFKSSSIILGIFILVILFLEVTFKTRLLYFEFRAHQIFNMDILRNILFTITYGLFVLLFLKLFRENTVKYLFVVFTILLVILYFSQDIYFLISNNFYSFAISGEIAKGFTFFYRLPQSLTWSHTWYLVPILTVSLILKDVKKNDRPLFNIRYTKVTQPFGLAFLAFFSLFISVQTISSYKNPDDIYDFSDYDLYIQPVVPHSAMRKFGVITYARIDLQNAMIRDREQNELSMHDLVVQYFNEKTAHEVNEMTNIFEGKNLIMIMAEALDTYAIDPIMMPNLSALMEASWYFDNFYAPLYYRNTADTEFMVQTGFYPNKSVQLSMLSYIDNTFPNTFPRLFEQAGHTPIAFHNFSDHFYPREMFHPNALGYHAYYNDSGLGLITPPNSEREARGHYWHSDLEMFQAGLPILLENEKFFGYFLTVTGHLPYESARHDYALKHSDHIRLLLELDGRDEVDESIIYYHAAQWEFDLAVGYLIEHLEEANVLDDTVIVIFGDHYAYGLDRDVIWDYDTVKNPETMLNIHNVPLIVYTPGLEQQNFDNFFATVDLLPTLSNMFGLNLDYQQVMGEDAFNSVLNTVIFSSTSFLTRDYYYEVERDIFRHFGNEEDPQVDFRPYIGQVFHRINVNNYVLNNDYFSELYGTKEFILEIYYYKDNEYPWSD